jgi:hypothetical protein
MIMCSSCKEGTGGAIVTRREAYRLGMRTMGPPPAQHRANTGTGLGGGGGGEHDECRQTSHNLGRTVPLQ